MMIIVKRMIDLSIDVQMLTQMLRDIENSEPSLWGSLFHDFLVHLCCVVFTYYCYILCSYSTQWGNYRLEVMRIRSPHSVKYYISRFSFAVLPRANPTICEYVLNG